LFLASFPLPGATKSDPLVGAVQSATRDLDRHSVSLTGAQYGYIVVG
jgi:hypothetical protein